MAAVQQGLPSDLPLPHLEVPLESLGVFKPNKDAPLHRWVSLTEGFSAQLVVGELADVAPGALVYDPFGGTGTTPLVAAQLGHRGAWAEVNPYLREAAAVKIAAATTPPSERATAIQDLQEALLRGPDMAAATHDHVLIEANERRDFFQPPVARELVGWVARFESCTNSLASRTGRLGVASAAISVSNMKRAVDLRRRTPAELRRERPPVGSAVRDRVQMFIDDLRTAPTAPGSAELISDDARRLPPGFGKVDFVITSPPYLNGTNYFRNTKLELMLLRLIAAESDLGSLRSRAVTAGINNVSRRIAEPPHIDAVEPVAATLDEVAYDPRIPKMVRAYFADMQAVLRETLGTMKRGGKLVLDIGDSRFAGVHVDTPELISAIARNAGWRLESVRIIRTRVAKDGGRLCQKLLYLSPS